MRFYVVRHSGEPDTHVIYDARKLDPGFCHTEGVIVCEIKIGDHVPDQQIHGLMAVLDMQFLILEMMDAAYMQGRRDQ